MGESHCLLSEDSLKGKLIKKQARLSGGPLGLSFPQGGLYRANLGGVSGVAVCRRMFTSTGLSLPHLKKKKV